VREKTKKKVIIMKVKWVLITLTLGALTHDTNGLLGDKLNKLMKKAKKINESRQL